MKLAMNRKANHIKHLSSVAAQAFTLALLLTVWLSSSVSAQEEPPAGPPPIDPEFLAVIELESDRCQNTIIDIHFHLGQWFTTASPLVAEMDASMITAGLLMAVYGRTAAPPYTDPNEDVARMVQESPGRIFGLASLNTTGSWDTTAGAELERLVTYLSQPGFVGCKLAPPHTCLPLQSDIMRQIIETIAISSNDPPGVAYIHIGTTPFCGALGEMMLGYRGCCSPEYVDPTLLEDLMIEYAERVTFVLVHAGADFLPSDDENYYNGTMVDQSLALAAAHENVYLEISAFLRLDDPGNETAVEVYPGGALILEKIQQAGLAHKTMYGSDANHFPGGMAPYLATAITRLQEAGFTEEERCMILGTTAIQVFGLDLSSTTTATPMSNSSSSNSNEGEEGATAEVDGDGSEEGTSEADSETTETNGNQDAAGSTSSAMGPLQLTQEKCLGLLAALISTAILAWV